LGSITIYLAAQCIRRHVRPFHGQDSQRLRREVCRYNHSDCTFKAELDSIKQCNRMKEDSDFVD
jgi:hypothetical protein